MTQLCHSVISQLAEQHRFPLAQALLQNHCCNVCIHSFLTENEGIVPPGTFIQGSRASISSPWVGDDGNPLPYLPSTVENGNVPIANLLWFRSLSPTAFSYAASDNTVTLTSYVCEIQVLFLVKLLTLSCLVIYVSFHCKYQSALKLTLTWIHQIVSCVLVSVLLFWACKSKMKVIFKLI